MERKKDLSKLTTEELFELYEETKDVKVRNEIAERYRNLVHEVAKKYRIPGEEYADLFQVGMIGLLKAIERFDPSRGIAFTSFAVPTISGEIKRYLRDRSGLIKIPRRLKEFFPVVNQVREELAQTLGREPTVAEIARTLKVREEIVLEALRAMEDQQIYSLESGLESPSGEMRTIQELVGKEPDFDKENEEEILKLAIERLPEDERKVITMRFFEGKSQKEIAKILGVSQAQVSRLQKSAIRKLRRMLKRGW